VPVRRMRRHVVPDSKHYREIRMNDHKMERLSDMPDTKRDNVLHRFLLSAGRTPDAAAVIDDQQSLTYRELRIKAARLAFRLQIAKGDDTEPVALLVGRNCHMAVALVAVALLGSSCVVISPTAWKRDIARATHGRIVITEKSLRFHVPGHPVLLLEEDHDGSDYTNGTGLQQIETNAIYSLFPTGDVITIAQLSEHVRLIRSAGFPVQALHVSFDLSSSLFLLELWTALASSGCAIISSDAEGARLRGGLEHVSAILSSEAAQSLRQSSTDEHAQSVTYMLLGQAPELSLLQSLASCGPNRCVYWAVMTNRSRILLTGVLEAHDPTQARIAGQAADVTTAVVYADGCPAGEGLPGELRLHLSESNADISLGWYGTIHHDADFYFQHAFLTENGATPDSETEHSSFQPVIIDAWKTILGVSEINPATDFFEHGGNSLLAMRLVASINDACGTNIPWAVFLREPTIKRLVEAVDQSDRTGSSRAVTTLRSSQRRNAADTLASIDDLTDEQVQKLLSQTGPQ
jgi:acyl carrier protein